MSLPSESSEESDQTDEFARLPFRGIATAAVGAAGAAVLSPIVFAVGITEFIGQIWWQSPIIGLILAIVLDRVLGRLTDSGNQWPRLPAWISSTHLFVLAFASGTVGFAISLLSPPPWAPAVAIGGMEALAVASVAALVIGGTHSTIWMIR